MDIHLFRERKSVLRSWVFCFSGSLLVAIISLIRQDGFGVGDLVPFVFWTVLFTTGIAFVAGKFTRITNAISTPLAYLLAIVLGTILPYLWVVVVAFILGPFIMAFSFPLLPAWVTGGVSGLVASLIPSSSNKRINTFKGILLLIVFSAVAAYGGQPLLHGLAGDVQVTMTFVEWHPSLSESEVLDENEYLTGSEIDQIKAQNLGGKLLTRNQVVVGIGFPIRIVFIISRNTIESVILPLPKRSAIYIIDGQNWSIVPEDTPTFGRSIEMSMPLTYYGGFQFEYANGAISSFGTFTWSSLAP